MGFHWPKEITERPLLTKVVGSTVHFKDGSTAEVINAWSGQTFSS